MEKGLFLDSNKLEAIELMEGISVKPLYYGESAMALLFIIEGEVPKHKHESAQIGFVIEGRASFTIGDEERVIGKGGFYHVPSNVEHSAKVIKAPLKVVDIFIPPREDYIRLFR